MFLPLFTSVVFGACTSADRGSTAPKAAECDNRGWRGEVISMPPEWGPLLPAGRDELRFAPGMFDVSSPEHFSYVFVLSWHESQAADAESLSAVFTNYFRGLLTSVGSTKGIEVEPQDISVQLKPGAADGKLRGHAEIVDVFTNGQALTLQLELDATDRCVRIAASPRADREGELWARLRAELACIACQSG